MFEAENIRDWRGHDVVDADGHKIGALEAVYVDTGTDLPSLRHGHGRHDGSSTGWCSCRLTGRSVGPGHLKVMYTKEAGERRAPRSTPTASCLRADEEVGL